LAWKTRRVGLVQEEIIFLALKVPPLEEKKHEDSKKIYRVQVTKK
jgi:hypothetical protein